MELGTTLRKYKRFAYTQESLEEAINDVISKKCSLNAASVKYHIPKSTLHNKINFKVPLARKMGPPPVLTKDEEHKLAEWIIKKSNLGFPMHPEDVFDTIQIFLNEVDRETKFKDNRPGRKWLTLFLNRHPELTKRNAEMISKARASVKEENIRKWFKELEKHLEEEDALDILNDPSRIFNADETGVQTCPKTGLILGPKNYKDTYTIACGKEKESITVLCNFSADGTDVPPYIVYPYKRIPRDIAESVPDDWSVGRSDSGWMLDGSTHVCSGGLCAGGVGRNVGEALWRLRGPGTVHLITAIGDDTDGQYLDDLTPGLIAKGSFVKGGRTPTYAAVLDPRGECSLGLGDMTLHQHITTEMISSNIKLIENASLVVMDGNPPLVTVEHVLQLCAKLRKPVFFEPTDRRKALKPFVNNHKLAYASPNQMELIAIASTIQPDLQVNLLHPPSIDVIIKLCTVVSELVNCIVVTLGDVGVIVHNKNDGVARARLYGVEKMQYVRNVSGAGDCFASGFIHGLLSGFQEEKCVALGIQTAQQALLCDTNVPKEFGNCKIIQKAVHTNLI